MHSTLATDTGTAVLCKIWGRTWFAYKIRLVEWELFAVMLNRSHYTTVAHKARVFMIRMQPQKHHILCVVYQHFKQLKMSCSHSVVREDNVFWFPDTFCKYLRSKATRTHVPDRIVLFFFSRPAALLNISPFFGFHGDSSHLIWIRETAQRNRGAICGPNSQA